MKEFLLLCILFLTITSCQNVSQNSIKEVNQTNIDFNNLLESYSEEGLKLYPTSATYSGDNRFNDVLPNYLSHEFKEKEVAYYTKYKNLLGEFKDEDLSEEERLSKATLEWDCNINLEALNFSTELTPIMQMWTFDKTMAQFASGSSAQPFETVRDYENWLSRLEGYLDWMQTAYENMNKGVELGHVLPKSLILKVIPQLQELSKDDLENHIFYQPINNFPDDFSTADKRALKEAYSNMVKDRIIPAYQQLHHYMSTDYLEAGRITSGIYDTPDGALYYKHQIKTYTTTNMTADEIFELGLSEVERISKEMEVIKDQVGYKGDLISFFDFVRNNKALMPYKDAQQVIDNFNKIHKTMQPQLEQLFDLVPKTPFEIRRTEAFREASASAEYSEGSLESNRPGIFYAPIPDAENYNGFMDEALFLHEAIPGHHYQISLTKENENLPEFRKTLWYSAYGEGWALYTESLGKELGLYTDPYQHFGMLSMEMHRAIRLVVDPGIHVKGWSREKAIQYSLDNEAESEASIISEIERYMANPGQALSYKIGQIKINELRSKAEKTLGNQFDIREFHNQILETGCIPLALLEDKIDQWINSSK